MINYRPLCTKLREIHVSRNSTRWFSKISASPVLNDFDATKYRDWIKLGKEGNHHDKISIMSYNLLSRHYVWSKVFGSLDQHYLNWSEYRFPLLNETIQQLKCDIMCFQEMESHVYHSHWEDMFKANNYQCAYLRKPAPEYWGDKPLNFMDGVGIFINTDRFDISDKIDIHFGDFIKENKDRYQLTSDLESRVVSRNTVALILKLYDKQIGTYIYVANTHLYWSPKFNDVKVIQTKILLERLKDMVRSDTGAPIIMAGDFNSTPDSCVYQLLANGSVNVNESAEFENYDYGMGNSLVSDNGNIHNPFALSCSYGKLLENDKLHFTSFTKDLTAVLDHIWTNNRLAPTRILGEVDQGYCDDDSVLGFPNQQFPSDHIPLVAELTYI